MNIQEILLSTLGTIITALIGFGIERGIRYLNTIIKQEKGLKASEEVLETIGSVVKATYQTYVKELKDKNIFDKKAQKQALDKSLQLAQNSLSKETKKFIEKNKGDLPSFLTTQIEKKLYELKYLKNEK